MECIKSVSIMCSPLAQALTPGLICCLDLRSNSFFS